MSIVTPVRVTVLYSMQKTPPVRAALLRYSDPVSVMEGVSMKLKMAP